jgi:ABC-2 type transport system ATP-binding protein
MTKAIEIQQLAKTYADGTEALKHIDFEVADGDFCALLGANGAGKTTIIGILTGLVGKSAGRASVFGYDIDHDHQGAKAQMGVVPQELNFNQFEKVMDIILNQAGYYGIDSQAARPQAEALLKQLELWDKRNIPARGLSGGMKRRLMIARALVHKPRLLILDEPTAGVDVELRHSMWGFLKELNAHGTTILLTTHYLEEVEQLCRNAAIIKNGEILLFDAVRNLANLIEQEVYVVHVDRITTLTPFQRHHATALDETSFEIQFRRNENLTAFIQLLSQHGMEIRDFRPKANRIEQLFLEILKKDH